MNTQKISGDATPPPTAVVDDVACHMAAADGYGGQTPGSEHCQAEAGRPAQVADFHVTGRGGFWICFQDWCREGEYEEAEYLLGGKREVEG